MKKKILIALLFTTTLVSCQNGTGILKTGNVKYEIYQDETFDKEVFYKNIGQVIGSDPCVITIDDEYYLYTTNANADGDCSYICGYKSKNLTDFEFLGEVFIPSRNAWAVHSLWAPEVIKKGDTYYMYYSGYNIAKGEMGVGVATASSPAGPFVEYSGTLTDGTKIHCSRTPLDFGFKAIDPHVFIDDDDKAYIYVSQDQVNGKSCIYGAELEDDMVSIKKDSIVGPLVEPSQEWENYTSSNIWNEAPYVYKHNNKYYLTYSANYYTSSLYAIGYAISDSPLGSFTKSERNPILEAKVDWTFVSGPGHNSFFKSVDGKELFIAYHTHVDVNNGGGVRKINFDRVIFKDDEMIINGPSLSPQLLPSGSSKYKDISKMATISSNNQDNLKVITDGLINTDYNKVLELEWYSEKDGTITFEFDNEVKIKAIMVYDSADYFYSGNTFSLSFNKNKIKEAKFSPLYKYIDSLGYETKVVMSSSIVQFDNLKTKGLTFTFTEEISLNEIVIVGE